MTSIRKALEDRRNQIAKQQAEAVAKRKDDAYRIEGIDTSQYPQRWGDFVGQVPAKRQLELAVASAKARRVPLDHVLLTAPSGVGKTALALLVAREMTKGTKRQVKFVSDRLSWVEALFLLDELDDGAVVVYDEFHKIVEGGKKGAEWMLHYLQDGVVVGARGPVQVAQVTFICATTEPGLLPDTVVSRFPLRPVLEPYTLLEAAGIARVTAKSVLAGLPQPSAADLRVLAGAGNANPRAIRRLLTTLRDLAVTGAISGDTAGYGADALAEVLIMHDVTQDGLDRTARRYLTALATELGGRAGVRALSDRLGVNPVDAERVLIDRGFVIRTTGGREITPQGVRRVRQLAEEVAA